MASRWIRYTRPDRGDILRDVAEMPSCEPDPRSAPRRHPPLVGLDKPAETYSAPEPAVWPAPTTALAPLVMINPRSSSPRTRLCSPLRPNTRPPETSHHEKMSNVQPALFSLSSASRLRSTMLSTHARCSFKGADGGMSVDFKEPAVLVAHAELPIESLLLRRCRFDCKPVRDVGGWARRVVRPKGEARLDRHGRTISSSA